MAQTKRMLMIRGSGPPNISRGSFKNETYFLLCRGFIDKGIFDEAIIIYLNSQTDEVIKTKLHPKITLIRSPKNDILKGEHFDFVFVRAEFQEYPECLSSITYDKLSFYSATAHIYPHILKMSDIDIFYVNSKKELVEAQKKYHKKIIRILDKPVDENIFRPMKLKKKYDICIIANFRPRKHHAMIFEALNKLPYHKKLKIICVGNTFSSGYDAQILASEYSLNVTYTGLIDLKQVARIINESKIKILGSKIESNARALYEAIACDTPILVNSEQLGGQHMVNAETGMKAKLWKFDTAIDYMLKNYKKFHPHRYFKKHFSLDSIIDKLARDL